MLHMDDWVFFSIRCLKWKRKYIRTRIEQPLYRLKLLILMHICDISELMTTGSFPLLCTWSECLKEIQVLTPLLRRLNRRLNSSLYNFSINKSNGTRNVTLESKLPKNTKSVPQNTFLSSLGSNRRKSWANMYAHAFVSALVHTLEVALICHFAGLTETRTIEESRWRCHMIPISLKLALHITRYAFDWSRDDFADIVHNNANTTYAIYAKISVKFLLFRLLCCL